MPGQIDGLLVDLVAERLASHTRVLGISNDNMAKFEGEGSLYCAISIAKRSCAHRAQGSC
jgi:hypothetical protein